MDKNRFSLHYLSQLQAIAGKLTDSEIFFENKVRRWYSQTFNTPLHETFNLSWPFIVQQYYEDQVDGMSFNALYDLTTQSYLPDFIAKFEAENDNFAESLVEEQKKTLEKKIEKKEPEEKVENIPKAKEHDIKFEEDGDL